MATVKEIQKTIFQKLIENTGITLASYPHIRIYVTKEEHDFLASNIHVLSTYVFNRQVCFSLLECDGKVYFVSLGISNELISAEFSACENQKVLSMMSIASSKIERIVTKSESELLNEIFTDPSVEDVNWETTASYFPEIITYEVNSPVGATPAENNAALKHLALYTLVCSPEVLILPFEAATLQKYTALLNTGDKNIPEDNLLHSLSSNYWRFCYFDIYRCIERLYRLGLVHNFKNSLSSGLPIDLLHTALKDKFLMKTGVESHEDTNLNYLFSLLTPATCSILDSVRNGENYDKFIYSLRNKIVHFQKSEAEIEAIDDAKWNVIIRFLLSAIEELYPMFITYIATLPDE